MILWRNPSLFQFLCKKNVKMNGVEAEDFLLCRGVPLRSGLFLAMFLLFSLVLGAEAQTLDQGQDAFTISNIHVDITAETASIARKKALAKGEKRAFNLLLKRLTLRIDFQNLPILSTKNISSYVKDFGVSNEKSSKARYIADLTYRFKPREIRLLLRDNQVDFAETFSKPVLLFPIYQVAGAVALWDEPNPWREAWGNRPKAQKRAAGSQVAGLIPIIFGNGDLKDIATISAELAVKGDEQRLTAIAKRYRVEKTLVVLGTLVSMPSGSLLFKVSISRYGKNESRQPFLTEIKGAEGEGVDSLLIRSAVEIKALIEDQWKAENLLKFESASVLAVALPINNLDEWVEAKRRLAKVAVIENAELVLLSRTKVWLNVHFIGEIEQLKLALAQVDMLLNKEGGWLVKLQKHEKFGVKKSADTK